MMVGKAILFLVTMAIAKHHHKRKDDLDAEEKFFYNVYMTIHMIMDNLFESIGITTNFSKAFNTKLLLTMHYDLSNIADKNLDIFSEIKNLIKVDTRNAAVKVVQLDSTIKEVLNEYNYDAYGAFKETSKRDNISKDEEQTMNFTDIPQLVDSIEFADIVFSFLANINNLTLHKLKKTSKHAQVAVPSKKNLKLWKGPTNIELDLFKITNTRRLFGGIKAQVNEFPFMVSIHIMGEFACSGSIIHRDLIITAASCLQIAYRNDYLKNNLKAIYVRLGSDYTTRDGETIPVQNLYVHPAYNPETLSNNIVIISLEKRNRISRQQRRIRRIMFDKKSEPLANITQGILTLGWGATKKGQEVQKNPKLTMDLLDLLPTEECAQKYPVDLISKNNFCVGVKNSSRGACHGDLGGPGIVGAVLMGIVSYGGAECGATNSLTVFTKLGYYNKWIENILSMYKKTSIDHEHHNDTRRKSDNVGFIHLNMTPVQRKQLRKHAEDYPEEVKVLRDILIDLVKTDNNAVDEVIYGDLYEDFTKIIKTVTIPEKIKAITTKNTIHKHAIKRLTGVNTITPATTTATVTTTTAVITSTPVKSIIPQNIGSFLKSLIPSDAFKVSIKKPNTSNHESENEANGNEYTDNYEKFSNEYHGLSIEVPSTKKIRLKSQKKLQATKESIAMKASNKATKNIFVRNRELMKATDKPKSVQNTGETLKVEFGHAGLVRIDLDEMASNLKDVDDTDKIDSDIEMDKKHSDSTEADSYMIKSNTVDSDEIETSLEVTETTRFERFQETHTDYDIDPGANRNHIKQKRIIMRNQGPSEKATQSEQDRDIPLATRPFFLELDSELSSSDSNQNKDESVTESTTENIRISENLKDEGNTSFLSKFILSL